MKKKLSFIFLVLALILTACGTKAIAPTLQSPYLESRDYGTGGGPADQYSGESAAMPTMAPSSPTNGSNLSASSAAAQERLVIMNANLTVVVADPQSKLEAIDQMASDLGGFVVSMNMYQTYLSNGGTAPEGYISVRIPSGKLDSAINQIKADAVEVRNETRSGQDVTAEYVDLESRLRTLEAAEEQLTVVMLNATKTEDILNVLNQLEYYREQIEIVKGQMKYYKEASTYSLITVTLVAEETIQPIEIGGWKPEGVARDAVQALVKFLQGFVNFLIWFTLMVLPVLIVIFGPIALIVWAIVAGIKRRKARKAKVS
jgi:hypothetical protein